MNAEAQGGSAEPRLAWALLTLWMALVTLLHYGLAANALLERLAQR